MFTLIKQPNFKTEGVEVINLDYLLDGDFQELREAVYGHLTPAKNAKNLLCRGIRWGMLANGVIQWSRQNTYQLSQHYNSEEEGRKRVMDLIPDDFLRHPTLIRLVQDVFAIYHPDGDSFLQPYVVQLSAIRYAPTPASTAYPSPDAPHQDAYDNAIAVLSKTENLIGGQSRIYTLEDELRYETDLKPGQVLFVRDALWKHQVCPMIQSTKLGILACYRDILIIRIDPASR